MDASTNPTVLAVGLTIALGFTTAVPALANASQDLGPPFDYEGPGTVVTGLDNQGQASTVTDSGGVVCEDTDGDGTPDRGRGGTCIPFEVFYEGWSTDKRTFPRGNAVHVTDAEVPDSELAFQVCVDLDGSRTCGGPTEAEEECRDVISYSHDTDSGENFNPLFVPADKIQFLWQQLGCGDNGGFPGFVVFTCAGVHAHVDEGEDGPVGETTGLQPTHTHEVTTGTAQPAFVEERNQGDFCGAGPPGGVGQDVTQPSREKIYEIT